jgi:hypothetical protein
MRPIPTTHISTVGKSPTPAFTHNEANTDGKSPTPAFTHNEANTEYVKKKKPPAELDIRFYAE